jgi:hypothetical protein
MLTPLDRVTTFDYAKLVRRVFDNETSICQQSLWHELLRYLQIWLVNKK